LRAQLEEEEEEEETMKEAISNRRRRRKASQLKRGKWVRGKCAFKLR
jgi:hypothetical protein